MPGYVGLFSCTGDVKEGSTINKLEKRDCPVMSGFFHARGISETRETGELVSDCPVMSGFFHSLLNN